MYYRIIIQLTIGVSLMLHTLCNICSAKELKLFSSQELEKAGIDVNSINNRDIFTLLQILYSVKEPTMTTENMKRFVSLAEMERLDLNADGTEDIVVLVNQNATSDPVELFLLISHGNGFVAQILSTERAVMADTVIDLNNDGLYEVCVNESILGNTPHVAVMYWKNVYAWDGQLYVKRNEQFLESFYIRQYLPYIAQRTGRMAQHLAWGESRGIMVSVLEDCRKALGSVLSMPNTKTARRSLTKNGQLIEIDVYQYLSRISEQIADVQENVRSGAQDEAITSLLNTIRVSLDDLSLSHRTPK